MFKKMMIKIHRVQLLNRTEWDFGGVRGQSVASHVHIHF